MPGIPGGFCASGTLVSFVGYEVMIISLSCMATSQICDQNYTFAIAKYQYASEPTMDFGGLSILDRRIAIDTRHSEYEALLPKESGFVESRVYIGDEPRNDPVGASSSLNL